jgi:putative ABC transport system permease protein
VITRCLADGLFGGPDRALGKPLFSSRHAAARVVGVVEDVRLRSPFLYQSRVTAIFTAPPDDERHSRYVLRTAPGRAPEVRIAAERALARRTPGGVHVARLFSGGGLVRVAANARGTVIMLLSFAGILGVCALLGNLAVAAFLVGDRRRLIGVRRALGATRGDIVLHLIVENLIPTQIGCLLGLGLTLLVLPGVQHRFTDLVLRPLDAAATFVLLSLGGVAAKILPALRAARIPPSEAGRTL